MPKASSFSDFSFDRTSNEFACGSCWRTAVSSSCGQATYFVVYALSRRVSIDVRAYSAYYTITYFVPEQKPRAIFFEFRRFKTYYLGCFWRSF